MLTSYSHVCKLWVLPLKTDISWNVKTHQLVIVLAGPKYMLTRHTIFYCELFPWFIFLAECEIFNFVEAGRCVHTASIRGWWLLACYQLNGLKLPVMSIILIYKFNFVNIPLAVHCPETCNTNLRLHNSCWLPSIWSDVCLIGKTHNLQTQKYDVSMTSPAARIFNCSTSGILVSS